MELRGELLKNNHHSMWIVINLSMFLLRKNNMTECSANIIVVLVQCALID